MTDETRRIEWEAVDAEFQSMFDGVYPSGFRNYWKSQFVDEAGLSDEAIDTLCEYAASVPSPYSSIVIEHLALLKPSIGDRSQQSC